MLNILLGMLLICLGAYGLMTNWWAFLDLGYILFPLLLAMFGIVAIIAGITGFHKKRNNTVLR